VARDNVRIQVVASVGMVFAVWAEEATRSALIMSAHVSCEVCFAREGTRTEGTLVSEIREERRHDLVVVSAIAFPAERLMFE